MTIVLSGNDTYYSKEGIIMTKTVIDVRGMSCEHCVKAATDAVSDLDGVAKVKVSLKKNSAVVKYDEDKVALDGIKSAIREAGFEA
jgi:copper ion binding protein